MIDTALVCKALESLWRGRVETASRVRGRIEGVLNWARVRGYRDGENPARWKGHLSNLLPARSKVAATKHHAALPYDQVPAFITELRQHGGATARALEFLILTAARSNEVLGARWSEIDLAAREMALAHTVGTAVEAAYRRGDLFDKRRKLMEAWAAYCAAPKVIKVLAFKR
jgi:integrase